MGLSCNRDPPGFQHTLAESWVVLLLATPWENFLYVSRKFEHGDELLLSELSTMDNRPGSLVLGADEI